ncbi:MAG: acyl carrier protein [Mycobacterium sp.]
MTSSTPASIRDTLQEILRDDLQVDVKRATPDARLVDDLGMDSVAFAIGMVAIEDRLGAVLDEEDLLTCDTVGELEAAILAKVPAGR